MKESEREENGWVLFCFCIALPLEQPEGNVNNVTFSSRSFNDWIHSEWNWNSKKCQWACIIRTVYRWNKLVLNGIWTQIPNTKVTLLTILWVWWMEGNEIPPFQSLRRYRDPLQGRVALGKTGFKPRWSPPVSPHTEQNTFWKCFGIGWLFDFIVSRKIKSLGAKLS